jgi:tryptophan synthase alpha chain
MIGLSSAFQAGGKKTLKQSEPKLKNVIAELKQQKRPGLSLFLTGGYPDMKRFVKILQFVSEHRLADFLEIGIPFSDPVADGPVIQESSRLAIQKGATLSTILKSIENAADRINIPLVLMAYMNTLYAPGLEGTFAAARRAGFSAVIVPDLPVDESHNILPAASRVDMDVVFLASPASSPARIKSISGKSSPFLYYVSRYGTTGDRKKLSAGIEGRLKKVMEHSKVPVYCGFGISDPGQAALVGRYADGIIIGSALTKIIRDGKKNYLEEISRFAINIRRGMKRKTTGK